MKRHILSKRVYKFKQSLARKFIHSFCKLDRFKALGKIVRCSEMVHIGKKSEVCTSKKFNGTLKNFFENFPKSRGKSSKRPDHGPCKKINSV
jgi:hypothetical protein